MRRDDRGAALVAVVLITLALFAIGHGLLGLSLGELAASRAGTRLFESSAAAASAVNLVLAAPGPPWLDSVPVGGERAAVSRPLGRAAGSANVWRLSAESWWVEGTGRVGTTEARAARLAWGMDPLTRVLALRGAITIGLGAPVTIAGGVDASAPTAIDPPMDPTACDPWITRLDAHYALEPLAAVATLVADTLPSLGMLDFANLLDAAVVTLAANVSPSPSEALGACVITEPSNWGDPERPWRPCGQHFALRRSVGSLTMNGGSGQGVLVVDGDLVLDAGARFYGFVIASGALRVESGGELVGMSIATGGAAIAAGGVMRASACWAVRALATNRATLGRLRRMTGQAALGPL
jgi:hypothetical protein